MSTKPRVLGDTPPSRDLRSSLLSEVTRMDEGRIHATAEVILRDIIDEVTLGIAFEVHRAAKTGIMSLTDIPEKSSGSSSSLSNSGSGAVLGVDVFGQVITTNVGVPTLKKQPECICPNCQRNMAASRFAPHLEKCMGMGRNSSRLASRRIASNNKDSCYRESGGNEDEEDVEDEDWVEPGASNARLLFGGSGSGGSTGGNNRRKRDKNSPRRTKSSRAGSTKNSGESTPQEGALTPPANYDVLSLEERTQWLSTICGVISTASKKICSRSTRCPVHTDAQRREVRIRWLGEGEESHVDIDSFTEGDTAALRESLAQLSSASSPAESTISTGSTGARTSSKRNEKKRYKKGRGGSKNGSRGSTPPAFE